MSGWGRSVFAVCFSRAALAWFRLAGLEASRLTVKPTTDPYVAHQASISVFWGLCLLPCRSYILGFNFSRRCRTLACLLVHDCLEQKVAILRYGNARRYLKRLSCDSILRCQRNRAGMSFPAHPTCCLGISRDVLVRSDRNKLLG